MMNNLQSSLCIAHVCWQTHAPGMFILQSNVLHLPSPDDCFCRAFAQLRSQLLLLLLWYPSGSCRRSCRCWLGPTALRGWAAHPWQAATSASQNVPISNRDQHIMLASVGRGHCFGPEPRARNDKADVFTPGWPSKRVVPRHQFCCMLWLGTSSGACLACMFGNAAQESK